MAMTNGSNETHSQTPGSLFPLCKLKGNCTFAAQAVTVRNDMAEEDPGVVQKGRGQTEPSADEEVEALVGVEEADQSVQVHCSFC